jgi:hypothetical protein
LRVGPRSLLAIGGKGRRPSKKGRVNPNQTLRFVSHIIRIMKSAVRPVKIRLS